MPNRLSRAVNAIWKGIKDSRDQRLKMGKLYRRRMRYKLVSGRKVRGLQMADLNKSVRGRLDQFGLGDSSEHLRGFPGIPEKRGEIVKHGGGRTFLMRGEDRDKSGEKKLYLCFGSPALPQVIGVVKEER